MIKYCIISLVFLMMAGCSGTSENKPHTVSGVAAAGSVLTGTVYLKDSSVPAKELSMPIAPDGSFMFDLSGLTTPYILKAVGNANGRNFTLYSFASDAGIANINPLSSLAMTVAFGLDVIPLIYESPDLAKMLQIMNALPGAITKVQTALNPTLVKFGAESVNFITSPYSANHQGIDLFLDNSIISTNSGIITLYDLTASNAVQSNLSGFITGSYDFILNPVKTVGTVCISPAVSSISINASKTFSAAIIGSSDQRITWSVVEDDGGSITSSGIYTAPSTVGTYHVKATSTADSTKSTTASIEVKVENAIYLMQTGSGEYSVLADFSDIRGVEILINYDNSTLSNPRVTQGALLSGATFIANTHYTQNSIKFAALSTTAISGSGPLAIINFDLLGAVSNNPVIASVKLVNASTTSSGRVTTVPAPDGTPASSGDSVPSSVGSRTGTSTSSQ